jgi:uncharacterized protein (DUF2062 family)
MLVSRKELERRVVGWLKQGISPRQLALTLALGFTPGCLPVVGVTTIACAIVALTMGLNLPIIQAANYAAMPFQLLLIVPFLKLGARVLAIGSHSEVAANILPATPVMRMIIHASSLAGQAVVGWVLVAAPAAVLMTIALNVTLKRVPKIGRRDLDSGEENRA